MSRRLLAAAAALVALLLVGVGLLWALVLDPVGAAAALRPVADAAEPALRWLAALDRTLDRTQVVVGGGASALAYALGALALRRGRGTGRAAAPASSVRATPRAVRALAERGVPTIEIARRTGLPYDAVSLALATRDARRR